MNPLRLPNGRNSQERVIHSNSPLLQDLDLQDPQQQSSSAGPGSTGSTATTLFCRTSIHRILSDSPVLQDQHPQDPQQQFCSAEPSTTESKTTVLFCRTRIHRIHSNIPVLQDQDPQQQSCCAGPGSTGSTGSTPQSCSAGPGSTATVLLRRTRIHRIHSNSPVVQDQDEH